jgi:CRISPR-associated protein Cas6
MYWQDKSVTEKFVIPDDIQDLAFRMQAPCLPVDHAYALSCAITDVLPWLESEPDAGIHLIHVAESGNGWYRPADSAHELLQVSRRTRLRLRLPKARLDDARALTGHHLDVGGYEMIVGEATARALSAHTTLFSRHVIVEAAQSEAEFVGHCVDQLQGMGITVRKLLCGRQSAFEFPEQYILVRSLMLAELEPEESVLLQQRGLGSGRKIGCGLFIPHKGIKPVTTDDDE